MTDTPILELRHIGKAFGANRVLDDVSFELRGGQVHVLAGENGAGKSTLIKILAGIHTEYDGEIVLKGGTVRFDSPQAANRRGISVIHQELSLVDSMSVSDNIHLGLETAGREAWLVDQRSEESAALGMCRHVGLGLSAADVRRPVGQFPLAVKNCIEIAKALSQRAEVVVMDEPTSALGKTEVERLFALIAGLKASGCGIIYISHKMEEIYALADRITVLRDGRQVGTSAAVDCPQAELVRRMIGRELAQHFPDRESAGRERERPLLELRDFTIHSREQGRADVVKRVSLEVRAGEIAGIAGLQGSGAAELLHGLFDSPRGHSSGEVRIGGEAFRPGSPRNAIARGLALVTADRQGTGLVPKLAVSDNITLAALPGLSPWGLLAPARERRAAECQVRSFGIRLASIGQPVETLSGGNQQKAAIAKWLETGPSVMLMEDPTRGIDVGAKHEIYRLMQRWAAEGMAILLFSTELPELLGVCDRIVVLHRGELAAEFARGDATAEKIIAAAMGATGPEAEAA